MQAVVSRGARLITLARAFFLGLAAAALLSSGAHAQLGPKPAGKWLSGDFHQHTFYTDGSTSFDFVMQKNHDFGLDWWANSEHGGSRNRNGDGLFWDTLNPPVNILGAYEMSGGHRVMWRWQSLRDFVFPDILEARGLYPGRRIFSGLEWNPPGHEHCSVGVVDEDGTGISAFEYQFDAADKDFLPHIMNDPRMAKFGPLTKQNGRFNYSQGATSVISSSKPYPERHQDAVAACTWMQEAYDKGLIDNAWIIFAHVERAGAWNPSTGGGYNVEHFRDFNNAAPAICFGFEGAPGHQVNDDRGFGNPINSAPGIPDTQRSKDFGGTYGGVGYYTAKVGGLWDALLGEGRNWFNFANSDYHRHYTAGGDDFYPGEYQKTWVFVKDQDGDGQYSLQEIAAGLRSGNSFFVHGDLIDALEFKAQYRNQAAGMGETLTVAGGGKGTPVKITIKFKSPGFNNNGDIPVVDHIDLIAGEVTGKIDPASPDYTKATNESTKVIATFTAADWEVDEDGWTVIQHQVQINKDMYFRLRGTNLAPNTPYETDAEGNPLPDYLVSVNLGVDGAEEAWKDLWFYSNPIFVKVADSSGKAAVTDAGDLAALR